MVTHPWESYDAMFVLRCQTDGNLRTSDPDVYAIGDIAAFPLKRYGNTTRQVSIVLLAISASPTLQQSDALARQHARRRGL